MANTVAPEARKALEDIKQMEVALQNQIARLVELGMASPEDFDEVQKILEGDEVGDSGRDRQENKIGTA